MDCHRIDDQVTIRNYIDDIDQLELVRGIVRGLVAPQKRISSIFFYDAAGSKLFEEITRLPEYYPTRTEKRLLRQFAPRLAKKPAPLDIVEIGSGDCSKISILLAGLPPERWQTTRYLPVDVSREAIRESAKLLRNRFPGLEIHGIVADFTCQMDQVPSGENRLFCFLGSTLGNFSREQNRQFFRDLSRVMGLGDTLLLGLDMIKPVPVLERAYNDSRGVTAAFNRNILNVVNRIVGTDFDPLSFDHLAFYNPDRHRIEMHLQAANAMWISCPVLAEGILIGEKETIHTENSHKYGPGDIQEFAAIAGLEIREILSDDSRWFSLAYLEKRS